MTAKATLDLIGRVYRLIDREPATFCPEGGSTYPEKLQGCKALISAAASLDRWAVKQCNGIDRYDAKAGRFLASWTDQDQAAMEKAQAKAEAKARKALALIFGDKLAGLEVEFQRDPRGPMIKVYAKGRAVSSNPDLWV